MSGTDPAGEKPRLCAAVSVALGAMSAHSATVWSPELTGAMASDDRDLVAEHEAVVRFVFPAVRGKRAGVTVAVCDVCGRWLLLLTSQSAPGSCQLTLGCGGALHKAS